MMNYIERGAIFNLEIPKEGTIEIGIGDCHKQIERDEVVDVTGNRHSFFTETGGDSGKSLCNIH